LRGSRNDDLTDFAELALFTAMRRGEVLHLTLKRVDRARGVVLLDAAKTGKRRKLVDRILDRRHRGR
jgi:integrase